MKEWNEMTMEERNDMVAEIWAHTDDRTPISLIEWHESLNEFRKTNRIYQENQ